MARQGDKVRIRVGNLTMTNHPIHIHGHEFEVTGTDGGPIPKSARWPEVTTDVAVGQMRQVEFMADEPGDWAFHCHKSHHTMGAMGHDVPTMIGVQHAGLVGKIQKIVPDYMVMGERGMGGMGSMHMPLPDNTFPMMTGKGPYGPIEMGGMFTSFKVRKTWVPTTTAIQAGTRNPRVRKPMNGKAHRWMPAHRARQHPAMRPVPPTFANPTPAKTTLTTDRNAHHENYAIHSCLRFTGKRQHLICA